MTQPQDRLVAFDAVRDAPLHIVLVEPEIPPNTGNVARLCAATGCALHLVEPLGFTITDRELKRAGLDYWNALGVVMHASIDDMLAAIAPERRWLFTTRTTQSYVSAPIARGDALIFGKETAGLPQSVVDAQPDRALRLPMRPGAVRSINLSTAVGVATYAALAGLGFPGME